MMTKLQKEIKSVFKQFPQYWDGKTLLKNKAIEDIREYEPNLLAALLENETIKETYSVEINDNYIFKNEEFISMLRYKNYLENSYTKYSNQIGLTSEDKYLNYSSDVVLDFPHKDGVLEGGMTQEDSGKQEVFYHNVLAKEEIDLLYSPKILTNVKKYDKNGSHKVNVFGDTDNLIIKGNNLIALHTLKNRYKGKMNLIYIDPPFNTGTDSFKYNDRFSRSTWLTFMKNRLEIAKDLLASDGSIFIHIDTKQAHYLKVLLDDIFGENNFKNEIVWRYQSGGRPDNFFAKKHDNIYWYTKSDSYTFNKDDVGVKRGRKKRNNMKRNVDEDGRVYFSIKSNGKIYKYYEDELITPDDVWEISHLQQQDPERTGFNTQKPEKLLERIIKSTSNEGDIVLDFFMGSATTQAVAHKLNRQYIGIEQMDYIDTLSIPRLKKVIRGDQDGISKDVNWEGGGSFVYAELYELNQVYANKVQTATNQDEIKEVIEKIQKSDFLNLKVDLEKVFSDKEEFIDLTLDEQKAILIQVLDNNQLYLSYSEIDDDQYGIDGETKAFNASFYDEEV